MKSEKNSLAQCHAGSVGHQEPEQIALPFFEPPVPEDAIREFERRVRLNQQGYFGDVARGR